MTIDTIYYVVYSVDGVTLHCVYTSRCYAQITPALLQIACMYNHTHTQPTIGSGTIGAQGHTPPQVLFRGKCPPHPMYATIHSSIQMCEG